ncbi:hypothetical protein [Pollutibacter soli]|uniref:hypothetical protein n=1 Tax=Pollutibacter soli TaxID=3034157 RepID=UPI003013953A
MSKNEVLIDAKTDLHAGIGEHIGYELGAKMVKDYYTKTGVSGFQFVGRNMIEKILSQPDCVGISIYQGLDENGKMKYVFVGIDSNSQPILEYTGVNEDGTLNRIEGLISDRNKDGTGWTSIINL